ncbi:hypothetical protein [Pseudomonas capsici]|uniref:Lipoprotein n=1 Tax=Pseudomonas capsici TaxID=2810614 RepID=A0ABT3BYA8_9PSED|nr:MULTISPECIES: hypothetical protein [Pseudomonas]MCV4263950.1 hypothetical protein [Pseudomonas capsici]MCV4265977.1 hypothetical protein [Pseudomonas capsici]MCV4277418.1 hypothetical protein [Pseudomonas capsici]MCV4330638.1 hypothetical protein [Pseudomonas capsici]MCV4377816.1 hypothetical protein [Pseudomonas capsici]
MRFIICLVFFLSGCVFAQNNKDVIVNIYKADTALISGKLIRYYQVLGSPCVNVQILKPGGDGIANDTKVFCSLSGRDFTSDYTEVWLEKGEFSNDELALTLRLLPLTQEKDQVEVCRFKVEDGKIGEPMCVAK